MKFLILSFCLLASIYAFHTQKHNYDVVITELVVGEMPKKFDFFAEDLVPSLTKIVEQFEQNPMPGEGTEAVINDYADKLFENVGAAMVHMGLDPMGLPDLTSGFNYTLIIRYHGELYLTKGWLYDISSVHRGGDVVVTYSSNTKYLTVTVPIAFNDLQLNYDYNAKIMGLGPKGEVQGKVSDIQVEVKIGFDAVTLQGSLDEFIIINTGHIDVSFHGNPLVDWLINLLVDVVTALFKPLVLMIVENVIKGGLEAAIAAINQAVDDLINPTTPSPITTVASMLFN